MRAAYLSALGFVLAGCGAKIVAGEDTTMTNASIPQKPYEVAQYPKDSDGDAEISGTCELVMARTGAKQTCEDVSLFIKNPVDGEQRQAEFTGSKFRFRKLNKRSYVLNAVSSKYELETNVKNEVSPGQTLKIRLRAKDR